MSSKFQPDHMGRQRHDSTPAPALSISHGLGATEPYSGSTPNIARDAGRGKHVHPIKPHGSSTARQLAGVNRGGMGHATGGEPIASSAPVVPHAYGYQIPKTRDAAPIKSGMRSRTVGTLQELGRVIKNEQNAR
jgi:hypothetical protein